MQLDAQHLSYAYEPGKTVLHDVSLGLSPGEIQYILGPNGSGKTTLLSCLAGLMHPYTGQVRLNGKRLEGYPAAERAQMIGMIPQLHTPVFAYTVMDMVLMGRAPHLGWLGSPSKEDKVVVEEALEMVGVYELRNRPYTEISGGERQLTLIARGLAQNAKILLMDEPTAHLDLSNQHRVLEIVQQLSRQGLSFIISSHAPNDAMAYADKVLLLSSGWVIESGSPGKTLTESLLSTVYGIDTEVLYATRNGSAIPRAVVPRRPISITPSSLNEPESLLNSIFRQSIDEPQLIVVTGLRGAGKTSWCIQLADTAKDHGLNVQGILSPGIFKGGQKIGIAARDLATGEEHQLAKLRDDRSAELATPRWTFDPEVMLWANQVLEKVSESDLLIIDELGPLEFLQGEGLTAGLSLIDSRTFRVACVVVRSSLLPKVLQRWPKALVVSGNINNDGGRT